MGRSKKLTEEKIEEIRSLCENSHSLSMATIGGLYGVTEEVVRSIIEGGCVPSDSAEAAEPKEGMPKRDAEWARAWSAEWDAICRQILHTGKEVLVLTNNDERREWLQNYQDWGVWYIDEHIGATYYKYRFDNGAVLIVDEYNVPETAYVGSHVQAQYHLVGGPEPPQRNGIPKWERHEVYNRYPDSRTSLVEFLKTI